MRTRLPGTDLDLFPLCLGGNVFGWSADEQTSFAVLDAYVAAGGNVIDTADAYAAWLGKGGGESETVIGAWMRARGNRDDLVIATKVGKAPGLDNLRPETIRAAAEASLRRLGTDRIDLYYAHQDHDDDMGAALEAFDGLVRDGQGAPPRRVELLARAARRGSRPAGRARLGAVRRAAAGVQPGGAHGVRDAVRRPLRRARHRHAALLRARPRLPHRQVPHRRRRGRERACEGRVGVRRTTRASGCSTPSSRSPEGTAYGRRRWRWPGCGPVPRSSHRSPARARPSSSPICCRWRRLELTADELALLESASA